jgi:hypothetical protein
MKNITKIKNIIKRKVNESRLRNKLSVILDDALPNILAEMASLDYIEPTIKEEVNITDIKVGNILNFKDGETWKVIKIIGNKANPSRIMAGPYGKTRDRYISMPIEFTIDDIKKDVKSINEAKSETGINMVKKKLDALGVKYEMSKTDKVRPFKVIYKPINKSDQFYDKFEDIVDLFNLKGVVKSINEAYGKLVVSEGTFFRLPKNVIGNELYLASKNLTNLFNNANAGNDIDTGVIDSIVRQLNTVKKSVKKFNSSEEVKGTVYEAMISSSGAKGLKIGNKIKTQNGTYTITGFGSQTNATKDFEATNEKGKKFNLRVSLRGASGIQVAPAPSLNFPEKEEMLESIVNEAKTYKKGDKLKIKLKNGKEFDLTFDSYGRQKGMAFGKFKDGSGEYDTKPFSLDTIKESVVNEAMISSSGVKALRSGHKIKTQNGAYASTDGKPYFDYDPGEGKLTEAEDYKYKKYVKKSLDKIFDEMFEFRHAMGVKQSAQADPEIKKILDELHKKLIYLKETMKNKGLTEAFKKGDKVKYLGHPGIITKN